MIFVYSVIFRCLYDVRRLIVIRNGAAMIIREPTHKPALRWGIDIGGVLMEADTDTSFFGPDYLYTPQSHRCFRNN